MRLSTDPNDPGFNGWLRAMPTVRVLLNGAEVTHVLTADEEQRLIVQGDLDDKGRYQLTDDKKNVKTVTRYGDVYIDVPFDVRREIERQQRLTAEANKLHRIFDAAFRGVV